MPEEVVNVKRIGVLLVHGMGQQSTAGFLSEVASGLAQQLPSQIGKDLTGEWSIRQREHTVRQQENQAGSSSGPKNKFKSDDFRYETITHRGHTDISVVIPLTRANPENMKEEQLDIHLIEAYWAPLANGAISVWSVLSWLTNCASHARRKVIGKLQKGYTGNIWTLLANYMGTSLAAGLLISLFLLIPLSWLVIFLQQFSAMPEIFRHFIECARTFMPGSWSVAILTIAGMLALIALNGCIATWFNVNPEEAKARNKCFNAEVAISRAFLTATLCASIPLLVLLSCFVRVAVPATGGFRTLAIGGAALFFLAVSLLTSISAIPRPKSGRPPLTALLSAGLLAVVISLAIALPLCLDYWTQPSLVAVCLAFSRLAENIASALFGAPSVPLALLSIWAFSKLNYFLTCWMGDVAVLTASSEATMNYPYRRRILEFAVDRMELLFRIPSDRSIDLSHFERFDSCMIVAHSLGTVVAYEGLCEYVRRVASNVDRNPQAFLSEKRIQDRVKGQELPNGASMLYRIENALKQFVTLGCPLNKIHYFFSTESVASQVNFNIEEHAAFKHRQSYWGPFNNDESIWTNLWINTDAVSGPLDLSWLEKFGDANEPEYFTKKTFGGAKDIVIYEMMHQLLFNHSNYFRFNAVNSQILSLIFKAAEAGDRSFRKPSV